MADYYSKMEEDQEPLAACNMSLERETLVRMDSTNPRYMCCGKKVETLSLRVAIIEIVVSVLFLVVVLSVTSARARPALPSVAVTVVLYVLIKTAVSTCVLWGILRSNHSCLIAYLVFKGLEISMAAIGILVAFLCMVGMTTIQGLLATALRSPQMDSPTGAPAWAADMDPLEDSYNFDVTMGSTDVHVDYADDYVNASSSLQPVSITGLLAGLLVLLCFVIGSGVYFFISVLKTYHMLQDKDYHEYNLGLRTLKPAGDSFVGLHDYNLDNDMMLTQQDLEMSRVGTNSYRIMVAPNGHVYQVNEADYYETADDTNQTRVDAVNSPLEPPVSPTRDRSSTHPPPRSRYPTPGHSIQHQIVDAFASMAGRMTRSHHAADQYHPHESSCENLTAADEDCGSLELETEETLKEIPERSGSLKRATSLKTQSAPGSSIGGSKSSKVAASEAVRAQPASVKTVKRTVCDVETETDSDENKDRSSENSSETGNSNAWTNADVLHVGRYFLSGGPKFERL